MRPPFDDVFHSLPPLGSRRYLALVAEAAPGELPPEVLARAFRELAAGGRAAAAKATLGRLLGERGGKPEYLRSLLWLAAKRVPPNQHWQGAEDLYHDAVALIVETLPTDRGRLAEIAWTSYCYQRLIDAWRRRQGRHGERIEPRRGDIVEPAVPPPWHAQAGPDRAAWLEGFVRRVLDRVADPLIREVAWDQWLSGDPSPISGSARSGKVPLTERLGKSRFQVHRALQAARAKLLAELESQHEVELDLDPIRPSGRRAAASGGRRAGAP